MQDVMYTTFSQLVATISKSTLWARVGCENGKSRKGVERRRGVVDVRQKKGPDPVSTWVLLLLSLFRSEMGFFVVGFILRMSGCINGKK